MSAESSCLSRPSSSESVFESSERKVKLRNILSRRKILYKLAARRVKWAKTTATRREIRAQIDREFQAEFAANQDFVDRLENENELLKKTAADILNKMLNGIYKRGSVGRLVSYGIKNESISKRMKGRSGTIQNINQLRITIAFMSQNNCKSLLSANYPTGSVLRADWTVPGSESPDSTDSSDSESIISLPLYSTKSSKW